MSQARLPAGPPARFRSTVHGTVFAGRDRHLDALNPGDALVLIPDPADGRHSAVWVHLPAGDPVGYLPPEIGGWLGPWLRAGGRTRATALHVGNDRVPSWRRLVVDVHCLGGDGQVPTPSTRSATP